MVSKASNVSGWSLLRQPDIIMSLGVDADLNAGLINEADARKRRREISEEADFYGAMDGASKFVRGDAIAAVIIILVNIVGGLAIGVLQQGLSIAAASQNYTL